MDNVKMKPLDEIPIGSVLIPPNGTKYKFMSKDGWIPYSTREMEGYTEVWNGEAWVRPEIYEQPEQEDDPYRPINEISNHKWIRLETYNLGEWEDVFTAFECEKCYQKFAHYYHKYPNIIQAMEIGGIDRWGCEK
jgi:hypothetical protein